MATSRPFVIVIIMPITNIYLSLFHVADEIGGMLGNVKSCYMWHGMSCVDKAHRVRFRLESDDDHVGGVLLLLLLLDVLYINDAGNDRGEGAADTTLAISAR
jgi:hypothetical protein